MMLLCSWSIFTVFHPYLHHLIAFFSSLLTVKAVAYPGDPEVVVSLFRKQEWKKYRAEVLDEIPKTRWLSGNEGVVKEPFRIN
jgi:hypothetical protein